MQEKELWILFLIILASLCFCIEPVVIVRSPIPGRRFDQVPTSNVIYKVVQIAPSASVYFTAVDMDIQNWTARVCLDKIESGALIEIYAHPDGNNGTLEVYINSTSVEPYILSMAYEGSSLTTFTISTLTIKVSYVQHWKWYISSQAIVNLDFVPKGTDAIFHLIPTSVINVKDFQDHLMVINSTLNVNPELFGKNKTLHVVGTGTYFPADLRAFSSAKYLNGCVNVNSNPPKSIPSYYQAQMEYYGIPVQNTLRNCIIYTHQVGIFKIQVPLLHSSEISAKSTTRLLMLEKGDIVHHQSNPMQHTNLNTNSLSWDNDAVIQIDRGFSANVTATWNTNSRFQCFCISDAWNTTRWNFNVHSKDHVLQWIGLSCYVRLYPGENQIIPNVHTTHDSKQTLEMQLTQQLWKSEDPSRMRELIWKENKLDIYDGDDIRFSFQYNGSTEFIWNMKGVFKWKIHIEATDESLSIGHVIRLLGDELSELAILSISHDGKTKVPVLMKDNGIMLFAELYFAFVQSKQLVLQCTSCNIEAIEQPNRVELIIDSKDVSSLNIQQLTNHAILRNVSTILGMDISDYKHMIVSLDSMSTTNLQSKETVELMNGCIFRNHTSTIPSKYFIETLESMGVKFREELLNCSFFGYKTESLWIDAPIVKAQEVDQYRDFKELYVASDLHYTTSHPCSIVDIRGKEFILKDQIKISTLNGTRLFGTLQWCENSQIAIREEDPTQEIVWKLNCFENQEPFISTNSSAGSFTLCNHVNNTIIPHIDFSNNLEDLMVVISPNTIQANHTIVDLNDHGIYIFNISKITWSKSSWFNATSFTTVIDSIPATVITSTSLSTRENPPILKVPSKTRVDIQIPPDATLSFLNRLQWNKTQNIFHSSEYKSDRTTCIEPSIQCIQNAQIDSMIHGNMCLRKSLHSMCISKQVLQVEATNQTMSCMNYKHGSSIQITEPFHQVIKFQTNLVALDITYGVLWGGNILSSILYPFGYLFDFGYSSLLVTALLEGQSPVASNWTVTARSISVFARVMVFGSDCHDSMWNVLPWGVVMGSILITSLIFGLCNCMTCAQNKFSRIWILGDAYQWRTFSLFMECCLVGFMFWWFTILWKNWDHLTGMILNIISIVVLVLVIHGLLISLYFEYTRREASNQQNVISYKFILLVILLNWIVTEAFMIIETTGRVSSVAAASAALGCFILLRFIQLVLVIYLIKAANIKSKVCKVLTSLFVIFVIFAFDVTSIVFGIYMIVYKMRFEIWQVIPYWASSFASGIFKTMVVVMVVLCGCHRRQRDVILKKNIQEDSDDEKQPLVLKQIE